MRAEARPVLCSRESLAQVLPSFPLTSSFPVLVGDRGWREWGMRQSLERAGPPH